MLVFIDSLSMPSKKRQWSTISVKNVFTKKDKRQWSVSCQRFLVHHCTLMIKVMPFFLPWTRPVTSTWWPGTSRGKRPQPQQPLCVVHSLVSLCRCRFLKSQSYNAQVINNMCSESHQCPNELHFNAGVKLKLLYELRILSVLLN